MTKENPLPRIEDLKPEAVWEFFSSMSQVPRCSKDEARIQAHIENLAERLGFPWRKDETGNIVLEVAATPGYESSPTVVLQGHLDMVCEKNKGNPHDFSTDPIRLMVGRDAPDGDVFVRADGTTLGADNGIGVSLSLAAASSKEVVHGPMEILLTADEEMGMTGAKALRPEFLKGRTLVNLDSEDDRVLYIGCAGGVDSTLTWRLKLGNADSQACTVTVTGLRGGHSGGDVHLNRGNAIRVVADVLLRSGADLRLADIQGGSKRNAIPREASALVYIDQDGWKMIEKAARTVQEEILQDRDEPGCRILVASSSDSSGAISGGDSLAVLRALWSLPNGVLEVSPEIPGLIQTSSNTAIVECRSEGGEAVITAACMSRSSVLGSTRAVARWIRTVGELSGAEVASGNEYPGWRPNTGSPLLGVCRRVYMRMYGEEPQVTAIHAGLECGIIGDRMGGIDAISFGPKIKGAHSPDERVYPASVEKIWNLLTAVLKEIAESGVRG